MGSVCWCVCLCFCGYVFEHNNFRMSKHRMMKLGGYVHCTKISAEFEFGGHRPMQFCVDSNRVTLELIWPFNHIRQVAPHSKLAGAVIAAGSDSSAATCGVRLRRWENKRRLSSCDQWTFPQCRLHKVRLHMLTRWAVTRCDIDVIFLHFCDSWTSVCYVAGFWALAFGKQWVTWSSKFHIPYITYVMVLSCFSYARVFLDNLWWNLFSPVVTVENLVGWTITKLQVKRLKVWTFAIVLLTWVRLKNSSTLQSP